jgi:LAGLIDADG DNA endonuclease family
MDDGYWLAAENTIFLCTDNFTLAELNLLINVLATNFSLISTVAIIAKAPNKLLWRIRFSARAENIIKLRAIVKPNFIPSMLYKLRE